MPKKTKKSSRKVSRSPRKATSLRSRLLAGPQALYAAPRPKKDEVHITVTVDDDGEID